jgi:glucosamine kinase
VELVLGIDGGGTSCRAALATADGIIIGRGKSGPANIRTDLPGARDNIVEAARSAFVDAGRDPSKLSSAGAVLGLAGSNVGNYKARLLEMLPFGSSEVKSDALIALEGALGEHDGAIAIVGTGSIFVARTNGSVRSVGGWGFLIGDLGGGARIGRDLFEQTLLAYDAIRPGSPLAEATMERFGGDPRQVVEFTTHAKPSDFGGFAPGVFEYAARGDAVAHRVIERAVNDIAEALDALELQPEQRLCLLGGLASLIEPYLPERYRSMLAKPLQDALGGAVAIAVRLYGTPEKVHG